MATRWPWESEWFWNAFNATVGVMAALGWTFMLAMLVLLLILLLMFVGGFLVGLVNDARRHR